MATETKSELTFREAAQYARTTVRTIERWVKNGRNGVHLKARFNGRRVTTRGEIDAFLKLVGIRMGLHPNLPTTRV